MKATAFIHKGCFRKAKAMLIREFSQSERYGSLFYGFRRNGAAVILLRKTSPNFQ